MLPMSTRIQKTLFGRDPLVGLTNNDDIADHTILTAAPSGAPGRCRGPWRTRRCPRPGIGCGWRPCAPPMPRPAAGTPSALRVCESVLHGPPVSLTHSSARARVSILLALLRRWRHLQMQPSLWVPLQWDASRVLLQWDAEYSQGSDTSVAEVPQVHRWHVSR